MHYLEKRGVIPTLLNVFESKRKGTLSAKANVHVKDSKIIEGDGFWPTYVYCRPWLSKERFMKHSHFGGKTTGGALTENNSID